jgi:hypothetical protein
MAGLWSNLDRRADWNQRKDFVDLLIGDGDAADCGNVNKA